MVFDASGSGGRNLGGLMKGVILEFGSCVEVGNGVLTGCVVEGGAWDGIMKRGTVECSF